MIPNAMIPIMGVSSVGALTFVSGVIVAVVMRKKPV
jgi:hypothetical protein